MHPALAIPEIVEAIFAQVAVTPFNASRHKGETDLARAARCCQHFSGPALDRLWSRMWDIKPLLDLLEGFSEETREGICILRGPVRRKEWIRFTSYSARIRTLYYSNDPQASARSNAPPRIDPSVFIQLSRLSQGDTLFPRLRELYFTAVWLPAPELLLFRSGDMLKLHFASESTANVDYALASYLYSLPDTCRLRELSFQGRVSQLVVTPLPRFPLRKLSISEISWNIDSRAIDVIAKLEHLAELHLDLRSVDFNSLEPPADNRLALVDLSLTGTAHSISSFLKKFPVSTTTLCALSLYQNPIVVTDNDFGPFTDACRDMFRACARYSGSLRRVSTSVRAIAGAPSPDAGAAGMRMLEPLLACRLIDDFVMADYPPISFTDHDIAQIAEAWPAIVILNLPRAPLGHAPSASALLAFARCCPHLTDMSVTVHTRDARAQLRALGPVPPEPHALRTLFIDDVPAESPAADVLALFMAMFPKLEFLSSLNDLDGWKEVNTLLAESQARAATEQDAED
ncbi:hypothetical protein FB451DRAFT_1269113 [Mycena latifolia]|nr:hypothetical protein FB451DRAFT_1269113 [Mycena latifolia]